MSRFQPDHSGPVPIYEQIKAWMQEQIVSGSWPERHKLRAEADLAIDLEVSRGTLRKAIAELTQEGLLVRSHGRGTFVAPGALEQPLAERLVTFSEDLISRGIPFKTEVLEQGLLSAAGRVASRLNVPLGYELFFLKRLRLVADAPLIVLHNYVLSEVCPGIEQFDFTHVRLFEALEKHFGLQIDHGRRTFQAQAADEATATAMGLVAGDPVMHIEQQTYLSDGRLIEFSDLWLRGDQFKLSARVQRTGPGEAGLAISLLQTIQS
ncbi:MAG TPA: GntR family transcriptional regulator [Anaerolineae bacterium]|nr:GntR family transcriptional regulator [Anaerolineae bacterium]HMR66718.1 GntR family transcriptional regulator [Anaerolineae bacterium]